MPPWDKVKPELFPAAFEAALAERKQDYDRIANNPAKPTFANTFVPMQNAGQTLNRVMTLFGVMTGNMNTPAYQALDREWSPKLSKASDEITFNPKLFARIEAIYKARDTSGLDAQQKRLVTRTYDSFVRQGAKLTPAQKEELSAFNQNLAINFSGFSQRLLADEGTAIIVTDEARLAGLPDSVKAVAKAAAAERGQQGWAIVNTRSAVDPVLTFATDRALREQVWRAFTKRGDNGDVNDTKATIARIVRLRANRAHLLGFKTHADWRMQDTMAKTPAAAMDLMMRVWPAAKARVAEEVRDMQAIADKEGAKITIEPRDYRFYQEKVRKSRYDLDQAELKPYFELNNIIQVRSMPRTGSMGSSSRKSPARSRCSSRTCASGTSPGTARKSACSTATISRGRASVRAHGPTPIAASATCRRCRMSCRRTTTTSPRARRASRC